MLYRSTDFINFGIINLTLHTHIFRLIDITHIFSKIFVVVGKLIRSRRGYALIHKVFSFPPAESSLNAHSFDRCFHSRVVYTKISSRSLVLPTTGCSLKICVLLYSMFISFWHQCISGSTNVAVAVKRVVCTFNLWS